MSEAAARTAVYNVVNGVTDKGVCYDYARWSADWSGFLDLFKTTVGAVEQIRGWMVTLRGMDPEPYNMGISQTLRTYHFRILGLMGIDDSAATEKTFAALTEDVAEALDAAATLHAQSAYFFATEATIAVFEPRVFGGVLCHWTEINIDLQEVV